MKASAKHIELYAELSDVPASIKAPVFAQLLKKGKLSATSLRILLSSDQKRLDFASVGYALSIFHFDAIADICKTLEYLNVRGCPDMLSNRNLGTSSEISQETDTFSNFCCSRIGFDRIPYNCTNLTFLDVSSTSVRDLTAFLKNLPLRVLRAFDTQLNLHGLYEPAYLIEGKIRFSLEELDVSNNPHLSPMQPLSLIGPAKCPTLKILRMNNVGKSIQQIKLDLIAKYVIQLHASWLQPADSFSSRLAARKFHC